MFRFNKAKQADVLKQSLEGMIDSYYSFFIESWETTFAIVKKNRLIIKDIIYQELDSFHYAHGFLQIKKDKRNLGEKKISSELGHLTGIWNIDWLWIMHHILLDYKNQMIAFHNIKLNESGEVKFYKHVPKDYYPLADSIYLKNVDTREPHLFDFKELYQNGSGFNKKTKNMKPIIGTHLWQGFNNNYWDLTELGIINKNYIWDSNLQSFELKPYSPRIERKSKVILRIGNSIREI